MHSLCAMARPLTVQEVVRPLAQRIKAEKVQIWIDHEQMAGSTVDAMAKVRAVYCGLPRACGCFVCLRLYREVESPTCCLRACV
jgi:hypothetical protein